MNLEDRPVVRRRRGAALEEALLSATWAEIVERGYGALTFESVAQRAGTSRTVIYRRWATKPDLVRAAATHVLWRDPLDVPDTGTLRGDLVETLRRANERRVETATMLTAYLGAFFVETGTSPAELRDELLRDRPNAIDVIIDRAVARGEIDADRATPRIRALPFDLFRNELLMTLKAVPDQTIDEIVDEVFLPLVRGAR